MKDRPKKISCYSASLLIKYADLDSTISRGGGAQTYEAVVRLPEGVPRNVILHEAACLDTDDGIAGPRGS